MKDRDSLVSLLDVGQLELHSSRDQDRIRVESWYSSFPFNSMEWKTFG